MSVSSKGWIKLYRDLLDHPIWLNSTPAHKTVLFAILLKANHSARKWEWQGKVFELQPGQLVTSVKSLEQTCGKEVSLMNIRTALKRFERLGFITSKSTNTGRLITIVNWHVYQRDHDEHNKQNNSHLTSNSQAGNKHLTPNKNIRMKKKEKNDKNIGKTDFNFFCEQYLKKDGIRECIIIWNELPFPDRKAIFQSLPNYYASVSDIKYIKKPMNFLLERHWETFLDQETKANPKYHAKNDYKSGKRLQDS